MPTLICCPEDERAAADFARLHQVVPVFSTMLLVTEANVRQMAARLLRSESNVLMPDDVDRWTAPMEQLKDALRLLGLTVEPLTHFLQRNTRPAPDATRPQVHATPEGAGRAHQAPTA